MFAKLYLGEFKKNFSYKTAIVFLALFVAGMAIVTPLIKAFNGLDSVAPLDDERYEIPEATPDIYTKESVEQELGILNDQLKEIEAYKKKVGFDYYRSDGDMSIYVKNRIAELEYIRDNNLYDRPLATYVGGNGISGAGMNKITAVDFIHNAFSIFYLLTWIYALVVSASVYPNEYKYRTIKLLLLRPVTRDRVTTAKLLYALTVATAGYLVVGLTIIIVGYCVFDPLNIDTVFSFNGGAFTVQDSSASVAIALALYYVPIFATSVISFSLATVTRKTTLGIVLPIVAYAFSGVITFTGLSRFFITDAMDFVQFAGVSEIVTAGGNFFISLPVLVVYLGALLTGAYLSVSKKDVA